MDVPKTSYHQVSIGSEPTGPIEFKDLLAGRTTIPMPRFIGGSIQTTVVISPDIMEQMERMADSATMDIGYSAFHCGNGVLKAFRTVILEVAMANREVKPADWNWATTRCAVCPELGANEIRVSYYYDTDDFRMDTIVWEVDHVEVPDISDRLRDLENARNQARGL